MRQKRGILDIQTSQILEAEEDIITEMYQTSEYPN